MATTRLSPVLLLAFVPVLLAAAPAPAAPPGAASDEALLGFTAEGSATQRALEARVDSLVRVDGMRQWMGQLTSHPHHVGSPHDRENAESMAALLRGWGYDVAIERFDVLIPTPRLRLLELTAPTTFRAALREPAVAGDATSGQGAEQLPTYNAYSIDGDVRGELVYVNHGLPADYDELARHGVDVRGRIVLARYGASWRGIKPKVAAEHGALGCILYSDPQEDGYFRGDVYPKGGYRSDASAQRGSVLEMPVRPGDPLTPGVGATSDAPRIAMRDVETLTRIPVLPISYGDALPLLRALGGPVAPESWRGALPLTYHIGPGPAQVHLQLAFDWRQRPLYDVIARLPGRDLPDEWIVRGNHHDAWAYGASDPVSGTVCVLEEARVMATMVKAGWRPRRTIVYALWDGEEFGLLGSTEWAEAHDAELRRKAALYINTDSNGRGFFDVGGSAALETFVTQAVHEVKDPETGADVLRRARAVAIVNGSPEERTAARERADLRLGALGSGSDFTPFLQHLGIASLNMGYGGEEDYGQYHSIYDSFDHFQRFGDPGFVYGATLVRTSARLVTRAADADVLPFAFAGMSEAVGRYVREVGTLLDETRAAAAETDRRLDEGSLVAAADPTRTFVPPPREAAVPYLNLAPLQNAAARLDSSARAFDAAYRARAVALDGTARAALDRVLMDCERALTRREGLPRRPWFQHFVYAPGYYTGYGVKTLPAVREAIEEKDWKEAEEQAVVTAAVLDACAARIDEGTRLLGGPAGR
jgi:N-acetylated-alpha-linked acidic dipeptidase